MPRSAANPLHTQAVQNFLPGFNPVQDALTQLAAASGEERGAVFTRREVVEFILDLSGYTTDVPSHHRRLLEPSFGGGEFLLVAVERLFNAYQAQEDSPADIVADLRGYSNPSMSLHLFATSSRNFQHSKKQAAKSVLG